MNDYCAVQNAYEFVTNEIHKNKNERLIKKIYV